MSFKVDFLKERKVYSRVRDVVYLRNTSGTVAAKKILFDIIDKMYPHISLFSTILDIRTRQYNTSIDVP